MRDLQRAMAVKSLRHLAKLALHDRSENKSPRESPHHMSQLVLCIAVLKENTDDGIECSVKDSAAVVH